MTRDKRKERIALIACNLGLYLVPCGKKYNIIKGAEVVLETDELSRIEEYLGQVAFDHWLETA